MKSILIIDNYDSFTYNLVHYINGLGFKVMVMRNDQIDYKETDKYHKIIISPGPGLPEKSGKLMPFLKKYSNTKSILGICLGQQAIGVLFQAKLKALSEVKHGTSCYITHNDTDTIYQDIPKKFKVGLYFSWELTHLPDSLLPTAFSEDGIIMSIKHKKLDLKALQYHPESIMTPFGKQILKNWLEN